jgi:hypothetical protein
MTKQQKWTPESPIEACATTYESLAKALGGLQNKFEIPEAAREFVKRTAAAAKDRSTNLQAGANKMTGAIEEALVGAVTCMADVNRKVVEAAYQDAEATFAAIDKLAGAQSADAYEVYVDYLRQQGSIAAAREERGNLRQRQGLGGLRHSAGRHREGHAGAVAGRLSRRHSTRASCLGPARAALYFTRQRTALHVAWQPRAYVNLDRPRLRLSTLDCRLPLRRNYWTLPQQHSSLHASTQGDA